VTGSLAVQPFDILLGTGALLFGACPRLRSNGTGTAAARLSSPKSGGGASPLGFTPPSARLASPSLTLPHSMVEGWVGDRRIFMNISAAIADSPLRQAWTRSGRRPGRRARHSVGQHPVQGCLPPSRLRAPVSLGDCAISRRTVMNNAG